jgi:hypothetical protein
MKETPFVPVDRMTEAEFLNWAKPFGRDETYWKLRYKWLHSKSHEETAANWNNFFEYGNKMGFIVR